MNIPSRHRNGISLIEVIACIVIVAAMMAPLAGVMQASNRSMRIADQQTVQEELVQVGRWLKNAIQDGSILQVRGNALRILTDTGITGEILVRNRSLIFDDGRNPTILLEGVTRIDFRQINQRSGSRSMIGLEVQMQKSDSNSGQNVVSRTVIAFPTNL